MVATRFDWLTAAPVSRASPLPQQTPDNTKGSRGSPLICVIPDDRDRQDPEIQDARDQYSGLPTEMTKPCGSGLARDGSDAV